MDPSLSRAFPADEKASDPGKNLPSPALSIAERHRRRLRLRNVLPWLVVVSVVFFMGHRYLRQPSMRGEEPLQVETVGNDQVGRDGAVASVDDSEWQPPQPPIFLNGHIVYPTDKTCFVEWSTDLHEVSSQTPLPDERRSRATMSFTLRPDVQTYVLRTETYLYIPSVQLHVVPSSDEHTTVTIDAFYDDPTILDAYYACTYHTDYLEESPSQQTLSSADMGGATATAIIDKGADSLQRADLLRLRRRRPSDGEVIDDNAWFNVTLSIPSGDPAYSLQSNNFDVDLHDGLTLRDVDVINARHIFARDGLKAHNLDLHSYTVGGGILGHFSSSGNVTISASEAPVDVHIVSTHSMNQEQAIHLFSSESSLKAAVSFLDPSTSEENSFKIKATSREGPLNLTICDGSTYGAVSIDAEATNAPAHLSLDSAFEGTFVAKTMGSGQSERATVNYIRSERYSGHARTFTTPLRTRHIYAGAVGRGSDEETIFSASSFAEVRSVQRSAHIDF